MSEAGAAEAIRDLASAHRDLLAQHELQFRLTDAPKPPEPPAWLKPLLEALGKVLGPIAPYLFWTVVVLGVVAILVYIARELLNRRRGPAGVKIAVLKDGEVWRPQAVQAQVLLAEADALAAQGLFEEAAHIILLRSIEDIRARKPGAVRPSLTSRDIAVMPGLAPGARDLFAGIAQAVERSLFGGRVLDEAAFRRCRQAYESFAAGAAWS